MKERAHKFKYDRGGDEGAQIIFCKYCGHIAFYADDEDKKNTEAQVRAKAPCPLTPSFTFNFADYATQKEIEEIVRKKFVENRIADS